MASETGYNGWTNYETWNVKLWIDNDEHSSSYWAETAEECYRDASADRTFLRLENATSDLADRLKSEHEDAMPEVQGVWSDLLGAALSEVNWHEIAENMLADVDTAEIDAETVIPPEDTEYDNNDD